MIKVLSLLGVLGVVLLASACQSQVKEVKSPCVGAEDSPCGPRRSANPVV